MGFRYRKSIKIMPGVRMNVSRSGIGYSAGVSSFFADALDFFFSLTF